MSHNHDLDVSTFDGQRLFLGTRNYATVTNSAVQPSLMYISASAGRTGACDLPATAARRLLLSSVYREVRGLACETCEGTLILRGQISSWHQKQVAQETLRHLPDIRKIVNNVEVVPLHPSRYGPG
ncbi:BON domain-containing protein [Gimesia maris]|uniref:BON domain-containing protein n=1 Tax=Gimesia maris TaxID=122 RepID=UPI0018D67C31|nr:BON domain-containing protein [Gimesia maris]